MRDATLSPRVKPKVIVGTSRRSLKSYEICLSTIISLDYGLFLSVSLYEIFDEVSIEFRVLIKFKRLKHMPALVYRTWAMY